VASSKAFRGARTALEIEVEASKGIDRVLIAQQKQRDADIARTTELFVTQIIETYDELHLANLRTGAERKPQLEQCLEICPQQL
jgi:hypothetical protein